MAYNKEGQTGLETVRLTGSAQTVNSISIEVEITDDNEDIVLCSGTTKPTDGSSGYAVGCIFRHTDGTTNTALYINEGTKTSCSFTAVALGAMTNATTVTLTDEGTDTTCFPIFAATATGDRALLTDASALGYNSATGALSATSFVGALTGSASGGAVTVTAGAAGATGTGGAVNITSGAATTGNSGDVTIKSGDVDTGNPGTVTITAGAPTTGNGGSIAITATAGAGAGAEDGGSVTITPGAASGGTAGIISLAGTTRVATDTQLQFRDTGLYINSSGDGVLNITSDTTFTATSPDINLTATGTVTVSNDLAVTGRVVNSTVTAVDIHTAGHLDVSVGNIFKVSSSDGAHNIVHGSAADTTNSDITNGTTGQEITIIFTDGNVTVVDANTLMAAGNFGGTANDTMKLVFDGTNWYEICRSAN